MDEEYTEQIFPKKKIRRWKVAWFNKFWSVPSVILELEEKEGYDPELNLYVEKKKISSTSMHKGGLYIDNLEDVLKEYRKAKKRETLE